MAITVAGVVNSSATIHLLFSILYRGTPPEPTSHLYYKYRSFEGTTIRRTLNKQPSSIVRLISVVLELV
jgi:hypothetical protein